MERFKLGDTATYSQTITDADIKSFAGISGDNNPVHMSDEYAEESRFKKRIAHGLISASFFSALFGTKLPGPGCVYVNQSLKFLRPVYINDTVTARVVLTDIDVVRRRLYFDTICEVNRKKVITGKAEIYLPE
ncbi:MaoC family dehydratase [Escherichia coli]|nr:MaoC family dehydratase [Escherichia coli]EFK3943685.1 MaoC family dehydratase [Escherichia coli]EFK3987457.1 MaoC family dehydratase [Escherichia coli]EGM8459271.1 MaoC family dehydratase [Escherichia coli]EHV5985009.1 MaoC family dehydratase [Escherichia coli]